MRGELFALRILVLWAATGLSDTKCSRAAMPFASGTSWTKPLGRIVRKATENPGAVVDNNVRLRELIKLASLSQREALDRFNMGLMKPYSESAWKAFLADPMSVRWRRVGDRVLAHAEQALAVTGDEQAGVEALGH